MNGKRGQNINDTARSPNSSRNFNQVQQNTSRLSRSIIANRKDALKKGMSSVELELLAENNLNTRRNQINKLQTEIEPILKSIKDQRRRPWFIWIVSIVQICVFIGEIINNWVLTHRPIETNLSINPLFGPSPLVLINMGASFLPCMHSIDGITNNVNSTNFPCPNSTTLTNGGCTLSDLCGFNGVSNKPNQWFRFIIPIFLHAGIVHIVLNLFTQLVIAGEIERKIGVLRIFLIYFTSGSFGFIFGGNFGPEVVCRIGCSGSLFAIIALSFLDLLYNWKKTKRPRIQLIIHSADIIVNFVLGLLPGIDNFSHIGGFCMGLLLGLAILRSPINLQRCKKTEEINIHMSEWYSSRWHRRFFHNRPKTWWTWWLVRFIAFAVAIAIFVILIENFYSRRIKCTWCQYMSCLPINGWCNIGRFNTTNS